MHKFHDIIATLIYDYNWKWLESIIIKLCELEMFIRDVATPKLSRNPRKIPEGMYCYAGFHNVCSYWSFSRIARFFFGEQSCGFCYYCNAGDFNTLTTELWDMCKWCGINDEDEEDELCNLEL